MAKKRTPKTQLEMRASGQDSVPLFPKLTEEGTKTFNKALEGRTEADYQCYMFLRKLIREEHVIDQIMNRYDKTHAEYRRLQRLMEEGEKLLKSREDANDDMLKALAGRS